MDSLNKRINMVVSIPAAVVLFLMMGQITVNALMRTFLNQPILYTQELVQYIYLPVVALFGMIAAQAANQHIASDLISKYFPPSALRHVRTFLSVLCSCLLAVVTWYTLQHAFEGHTLGVTAGITDIPIWPIRYLVPVVFAALTLQLVIAAIQSWTTTEAISDKSQSTKSPIKGEQSE